MSPTHIAPPHTTPKPLGGPWEPASDAPTIGDWVNVEIEVSRWSFIKRTSTGSIDLVAPGPCPFNYGAIPDTVAPDGDRRDVVLLGPRLPAGTRLRARVVARLDVVDGGAPDPKWICADRPLRRRDAVLVRSFFELYTRFKRVLYAAQGTGGLTAVRGWAS